MDSLLDPRQGSLLPALPGDEALAEHDVSEALSRSGTHTASRLYEANPRLYKAICWAYASGAAGQLAIAKHMGVSVHTVRAIIAREGLRRAAMQGPKIQALMEDLREHTIEALLDRLADPAQRAAIPWDKLMIGLGIQCDKLESLRVAAPDGAAPDEAEAPIESYSAWLRSGSIEVAPEMGIEGEERGQIADGEDGDGAGDVRDHGVDPVPAGDCVAVSDGDGGCAPGGAQGDTLD